MSRLIGLFALALLLASCRSLAPGPSAVTTRARCFLESSGADAVTMVLPQSGVAVRVSSRPVLTEIDFANAEMAQVELGKCLMLQLTPAAARDLYKFSVQNLQRRLVLMINDQALGARRIDGPLGEGALFFFVELPDAELARLVANLKQSATALQRELARR
jgi:hypothetical protein